MPDIGATLREARMRAQIDITEVESATKIRAKYLRALENEEWDLLPGPTYVKSFLRTYAELLGLDAKLLVDEYKVRHERLSEVELQPISAAAAPGRERRRRQGPLIPRWAVIAVIFAALIAALSALGSGEDDDPAPGAADRPAIDGGDATPDDPSADERETRDDATPEREAPRRPEPVRLRIQATGAVFVCLRGGDRTLVDGETMQAGDQTDTFRSRRFRLTLGNNGVRLIINGTARSVPASSGPIGLQITPRNGRQPLDADERPTCE